MNYLTFEELERMDFKFIGSNVKLSRHASFYNCAAISISDNTRIDDFCVLSAGIGGIEIGRNVHIAVYSSIIGAGSVCISDFANISSRVSIYSSNDDYTGATMTNPTVPGRYKDVRDGAVTIGKHVIVGAGSIILPDVSLEVGVAVGALSLVKSDCAEFSVYAGIPARLVSERKRDLLEAERLFLAEEGIDNV